MTYVVSISLKRGNGANEAAPSAIKVAIWKWEVLLEMLCNSEMKQDFKASRVIYSILILFYISVQLSVTLPVSNMDYSTTTTMLINNSTNNSFDDNLYVIKAVVYEIGILTDANETNDDTTERQDVKISFYNPPNTSNRF